MRYGDYKTLMNVDGTTVLNVLMNVVADWHDPGTFEYQLFEQRFSKMIADDFFRDMQFESIDQIAMECVDNLECHKSRQGLRLDGVEILEELPTGEVLVEIK